MSEKYDPQFPVGFYVWERERDPVKERARERIAELREQHSQETDYWKRLELKNYIGALRMLIATRR